MAGALSRQGASCLGGFHHFMSNQFGAPSSRAHINPVTALHETAAWKRRQPGPSRPLKLSVLGTGYLGATHAACMAELGYDVLGVDVDPGKIEALSEGRVPFFEPGLEEILERNIAAGRLRFTTSYAEAAEFGDVHFIGVGTPQKKGEYAADVSALDAVIEALAPLLTRPTVIAGKSTVPVGTAARLAAKV